MPIGRGRRVDPRDDKPVRRGVRVDLLLREAGCLVGLADPVAAEVWASRWLGRAWLGGCAAENLLCEQVCLRSCATPSALGVVAVSALARVGPPDKIPMLTETMTILARTQSPPPWRRGDDRGWTPVAGWRAVDTRDGGRVLFVDFDGPRPHTLMAQIDRLCGIEISKLELLVFGAAAGWDPLCDQRQVPMPLRSSPVSVVLAELAAVLRSGEASRPGTRTRADDDPCDEYYDQDFVDYRALAWARCRGHQQPTWPKPP